MFHEIYGVDLKCNRSFDWWIINIFRYCQFELLVQFGDSVVMRDECKMVHPEW